MLAKAATALTYSTNFMAATAMLVSSALAPPSILVGALLPSGLRSSPTSGPARGHCGKDARLRQPIELCCTDGLRVRPSRVDERERREREEREGDDSAFMPCHPSVGMLPWPRVHNRGGRATSSANVERWTGSMKCSQCVLRARGSSCTWLECHSN